MTKLTPPRLRTLIKKPGRHSDGGGLFFRVLGDNKAYFVYRFRIAGREREMSLGPYPELGLGEARRKHADLRAQVLNKVDPLAGKRGAIAQPVGDVPTFGAMADDYVATHENSWRNSKSARQWTQTLTAYCGPIRSMPVDQIATANVLAVLKPLWARAPETASRLRGRIEAVIDAARALGHIAEDKANPSRWKGHLDKLLPKRAKLTHGHHAAMDYRDVGEFVAKLQASNNMAARAMEFLILSACRSGEVLGARWDEFNFETATWTVPPSRMKTGEAFSVPLSDRALDILRGLDLTRGKNAHVFAGRPQRPLSPMSLAMLMRRMKVTGATPHGFRTSFRTWCSDIAHVEFEIAEACLSHRVGSAVSRAYARSDMLARRAPIMESWSRYVTGADHVVVPLRRA